MYIPEPAKNALVSPCFKKGTPYAPRRPSRTGPLPPPSPSAFERARVASARGLPLLSPAPAGPLPAGLVVIPRPRAQGPPWLQTQWLHPNPHSTWPFGSTCHISAMLSNAGVCDFMLSWLSYDFSAPVFWERHLKVPQDLALSVQVLSGDACDSQGVECHPCAGSRLSRSS